MKMVDVHVEFLDVEMTEWLKYNLKIVEGIDYFSGRIVYSVKENLYVRLHHVAIPSSTPVNCSMKKNVISSQMLKTPALDIEVDTSTIMPYMMPWITNNVITLTSRIINCELQDVELLKQSISTNNVTVKYLKNSDTFTLLLNDNNKVLQANRFGTLEIHAMNTNNITKGGGGKHWEILIIVGFYCELKFLLCEVVLSL
eukprot:GHVS01093761.1.p1 GENE.GHVS01093761.1~~GHVS01093761.1.p1  ORF type:complete len:199 (+),score=18.15 GHVS01093761.1:196-792(+)